MSSFHDKMYNHEVTPPTDTWDRIAAALDESSLQHNFPQRLYNMEMAPPAGAWASISNSLTSETGRNVAPVKRLFPVIRYAAAALLVGAVAFAIIRFAVSSPDTDAYSATGGSRHDSSNRKTAVLPGDTSNTLVKKTPAAEQGTVKNNDDRPTPRHGVTQKKAPAHYINTGYSQPVQIDPELSQSIYAYADHVPDIADRYVMLITPDGNIIRMSKKWSNLLCCVSGEEQDANCKDQIKEWQEKIATSTLVPSPGNFMDILNLVNSLNDNNGL